jgi:hypothetical protein
MKSANFKGWKYSNKNMVCKLKNALNRYLCFPDEEEICHKSCPCIVPEPAGQTFLDFWH